MISRKTTLKLADFFRDHFASEAYGGGSSHMARSPAKVYRDKLYDFLFGCNYEGWFCNTSKKLPYPRDVEEWIMKLHTGETQAAATPNWNWEQREKLGQEYLRNLAEDVLTWFENEADPKYERPSYKPKIEQLIKSLELDGYLWREKKLLAPNEDVLDLRETSTVLNSLYSTLGLTNGKVAFHHLNLSEEHFLNSKWDDSIANARKFFECTMSEVASVFSSRTGKSSLTVQQLQQPVAVRDYLEREGLLESKEKEAISKVYGLLSHTGGHPYMAERDQARLLRNLSLTLSQFVLLRLEGAIKGSAKIS